MGSLSQVKTYFKTHMDALNYLEHKDGFSTQNIPNTTFDRAYHVRIPKINGGPVEFTHQTTESSVTVSVFFKGYRYVSDGIDTAIQSLNDIIIECCKIANRMNTGAGVLNVIFESADINPFNDQNDNLIILEIKFTAIVLMGIEE